MNDQFGQDQRTLTANHINLLGFSLYRELATQTNLVFSPLGVYCVLRMLYEGARSDTRQAIAQLLYQDRETDSETGFQELIEKLLEAFQLSIANGIWIQEGYTFKPDFLEIVQSTMRAESANLDFTGQPTQACERINTWAAEQTHGRIKTVLSPNNLSELTRGILGNVLYFNARWMEKFSDPKPDIFQLLDGSPIKTPMIVTHDFLNVIQRDDYWAVEVPYQPDNYRGVNFSMILVVPESSGKQAFTTVEKHLIQSGINIEQAEKLEVMLAMPTFNMFGGFSLIPVLQALGLNNVFEPGADFSGISAELGFHLDTVLQHSYIKVDQYGTEAAAVTFAPTLGAFIEERKKIRLIIDRPFIYMLVDQVSRLILFMGKVLNPLD